MNTSLSITVAFILGLGSSLHCIGMCGGIISALSLSIPSSLRDKTPACLLIVSAFNIGRIGSYTLAGLLVGILVHLSPASGNNSLPHLVIQVLASALLLAIGLHLTGGFPQLKKIESLGGKLWKYLQPAARIFLPLDNPVNGLIVGSIWGWLPCGLVYSVLLWSTGASTPGHAALYMFVFGLGTLPAMIIMGLGSQWLLTIAAKTNLRRLLGILIIVLGLYSLYASFPVFKQADHPSRTMDHSHH